MWKIVYGIIVMSKILRQIKQEILALFFIKTIQLMDLHV